jgi:hypothetical protein
MQTPMKVAQGHVSRLAVVETRVKVLTVIQSENLLPNRRTKAAFASQSVKLWARSGTSRASQARQLPQHARQIRQSLLTRCICWQVAR